jgi:hypothetical protein
MSRQLISNDEAVVGKVQHTKSCSDCPWARTALAGWLGSMTTAEWIAVAHSDAYVECHTLLTQQCAGLAIYRKNMCKSPRDPSILVLDKDTGTVFSNPVEFITHHSNIGGLKT